MAPHDVISLPALLRQAIAAHTAGNWKQAELLYRNVLVSDPGQPDALTLLGTLNVERGNYEEGIAMMSQVIAVSPGHAEAYFNRGLSQQMVGRYEEALADYKTATLIDPTYVEAFWHRSLIHLTLGQYEEGWKYYEWRWKTRPPEELRKFNQPLWPGTDAPRGASVLVYTEQGFGDTLQFCRFLPIVAEHASVIFQCDGSLVSLMGFNFPSVKVVPFADDMADAPKTDYQIPLLSLPRIFRTTLDNIPPAPYLTPEPEVVEKWNLRFEKILKHPDCYKIGICWAGGLRQGDTHAAKTDGRRSLRFMQMAPLLDIGNTAFVSLQLGPPKGELNDERVTDLSPDIKSWSDTAAVIALLDLVISADTAVCHLAAAMGIETLLLNRYDTCWRWLLERDDSPWYHSLRQFRQKTPGDWTEVIDRVKAEVVHRIAIRKVA